MSSDDQYFLDLLSKVPHDVARFSHDAAEYSRDIADHIDRQFDAVAASLREHLQSLPWISEYVKEPMLPVRRRAPPPPPGFFEQIQNWVSRNRAITAAIVAFIGTGTFIIWRRRRQYKQKRRAKRAFNGARTEVVILAGSPHSPLTRSISLDLERRGFIVYIPASTLSEEQLIKSELRAEIHPLHLDVTSPTSTASTLHNFTRHLNTPSDLTHATLHLSALILLPSYPPTFPTSPITSLSPSTWSDTLNTHLLYPFTLVHTFLPLLIDQSHLHAPPLIRYYPLETLKKLFIHPFTLLSQTGNQRHQEPTSLILLIPSITPLLYAPCHSAESSIYAALTSYISTLRTELKAAHPHLHVKQLNLGAFDYSSAPGSVRATTALARVNHYDSDSPSPSRRNDFRETGGSPLRVLHNGVFDTVTGRYGSRSTIFLGRGAKTYDFVGKYVPSSVVGFMMGRIERDAVDEGWGLSESWEHFEKDDVSS